MAPWLKEAAVVLIAIVDLAVAATLVAIMLSVWFHIRKRRKKRMTLVDKFLSAPGRPMDYGSGPKRMF